MCELTTTHIWVENARMDSTSFFSAVLARLRAVKHSDLPEVAERSGVPKSTLLKIRYGEVKNPGVQTVQALHDYFVGREGSVPADPTPTPTPAGEVA